MKDKIAGKGIKISFMGLVGLLSAVILLFFIILVLIRSGIQREELINREFTGLTPSVEEIAIDSGNIIISDNENYKAVLNATTLNVIISDKKTGRVWKAMPEDENLPPSSRSPLVIDYLGKDNTFRQWDAHTAVIERKQYNLERIKDGIRIRFDFGEVQSYRIYEHLPRRISIKRYNEAFVERLNFKEKAGNIDKEKADEYRYFLERMYSIDRNGGFYFTRFQGTPPPAIAIALIAFTGEVGYTTDELIHDSDEYGLMVTFSQPASFTIYMDMTFTDNIFRVNIPVYEIASGNDFYTIQNIMLFPAFDCAMEENNKGYIFVPDGAGMLIEMDSYDARYPEYKRPLYNNTLFRDKFIQSPYEEELHVPVFGMYRTGKDGSVSGFMAVIESGAETSYINVKLKSNDSTGSSIGYNAVFSSVETMQYSREKIYGPYSQDDARYLATTGIMSFDYTVSYKLFSENAGYNAFASDYRKSIIDENKLKISYDNRPKLFIEALGAVTVRRTFLGIPYHSEKSLTNYSQAVDICDNITDIPFVFNYRYALNGGKMNYSGGKAVPVGVNGKSKDLKALLSLSSPGNEIFINANLMRVYRKGIIWNNRRYYCLGYNGNSNWTCAFNDYWFPDKTFFMPHDYSLYYLVNPHYLSYITDNFISTGKEYKNVSLTDFGSHYYGNYNPRDIINPYTANNTVVIKNLEKIAKLKTVALDNPNIDKVVYSSYALNISRESCGFGVSFASVPFRQLVFNGLVEYTTLNVNGAKSPPAYFLLQALELGSLPKFCVFASGTDILIKNRISEYYACEYGQCASAIKSLYSEYETAFKKIGVKEIRDHQIIAPNVFCTTYANGVKVFVNYNYQLYKTDNYSLEPLGYLIIPSEAGR